jgi:ubiquitin-protein ligase
MDTVSRRKRLEQDFATLVALRSDSPLFEFDPADEVSSLYIVRFSGRGLGPVDVIGRPSLVSQHEVEVRLPLDYPEQPPDIRWLSPLLHPNLSLGGVVQLADLQLPWSADMGLDVVCERLWDVARGAYFDLSRASNETARPWYDAATPIALPLDDRPLRCVGENTSNIVRYRRTGEQWNWPVADGILFIGEENAGAELASPPVSERSPQDILYIGPES